MPLLGQYWYRGQENRPWQMSRYTREVDDLDVPLDVRRRSDRLALLFLECGKSDLNKSLMLDIPCNVEQHTIICPCTYLPFES